MDVERAELLDFRRGELLHDLGFFEQVLLERLVALPCLHGGALDGCNIHPHNHYLQAATDAGLPGLVLFCAMVLAWLAPLARGLWTRPSPVRVGLFASALIAQWPLASTSSAFAIEIGGIFFVLLGWGLAEARAAQAD